jgi:hypothetical protein
MLVWKTAERYGAVSLNFLSIIALENAFRPLQKSLDND